jgi:hypothetical protein
MQKQMAKAMPTRARAFARLAGVVMSERIALGRTKLGPPFAHALKMTYIASWTLPSLSPPMTRESMYDAKVVLLIHLREQANQYA